MNKRMRRKLEKITRGLVPDLTFEAAFDVVSEKLMSLDIYYVGIEKSVSEYHRKEDMFSYQFQMKFQGNLLATSKSFKQRPREE